MPELDTLIITANLPPHVVASMRLAYDRACAELNKRSPNSELARTIAASKILRLAKSGLTDPEKLYREAIR